MDSRLSEDASHPAIAASTPCIKIDRSIPVPRHGIGRTGYTPEGRALVAMEVGDSFVWPRKGDEAHEAARNRVQASVSRLKPKKFTTRIVEENGVRVLRVWRVA